MKFFKALFAIILFPIKLVIKLVWKIVKWILMAPIRWIGGIIITAGVIFLLIKFVF